MKIEELLVVFKRYIDGENPETIAKSMTGTSIDWGSNNSKVFKAINALADYTMYEPMIVKKNYITNNQSTISYTYNTNLNQTVRSFYSTIQFDEPPQIGKAKKVEIKGAPVGTNQTEIDDLEKMIYVLDKIKDSLMHLDGDETKFTFVDGKFEIKIVNQMSDYSLKCRIPIEEIINFSSYIRNNCCTEDKEIRRTTMFIDFSKFASHLLKKFDNSVRIVRVRGRKFVLTDDGLFAYDPSKIKGINSPKQQYYSLKGYNTYHTNSYLTSLYVSQESANFPLLPELYLTDFDCNHIEYTKNCEKILERYRDFMNMYRIISPYLPEAEKEKKLTEFFIKVNPAGKISGAIYDLALINNLIVKNCLRNARAHANKKEDDTDEKLHLEDRKENDSSTNPPEFSMVISNAKFNNLLNTITRRNYTNADIGSNIAVDISAGDSSGYFLDTFLKQMQLFIEKCDQQGINKSLSQELLNPVDNANNFVDYLRQSIDGTYAKVTPKGLIK